MLPVTLQTVFLVNLKLCCHCCSPFDGAVNLPRASSALTCSLASTRSNVPDALSRHIVHRMLKACRLCAPFAPCQLHFSNCMRPSIPVRPGVCAEGRVHISYAQFCFLYAGITASSGGMPPAILPLLALPIQLILCAECCACTDSLLYYFNITLLPGLCLWLWL